jgi:16S rRNA C967 or C1407 C5-methylase (RsmB/RsmF family)
MSAITSGLQTTDCHIFSMDISSAIPSHIFSRSNPLTGLDLCCCPGGKLLHATDLMSCEGTIVGVDLSDRRLEVCRSLVNSYMHSSRPHARIQLFHADGVNFCSSQFGKLFFDSKVTEEEIMLAGGSRKRRNKSSRAREQKKLRTIQESLNSSKMDSKIVMVDEDNDKGGENGFENDRKNCGSKDGQQSLDIFDAVLVDAQCTHDGSYRHLRYLESDSPLELFGSEDGTGGAGGCLLPTRVYQKPTIHKHLYGKSSAGQTERFSSSSSDCVAMGLSGEDGTIVGVRGVGEDCVKGGACQESLALCTLQRGLIMNGFNRLRVGGTLVYSTCSLQREQNEDIVEWLLETVGVERVQMGAVDDLCGEMCVTGSAAAAAGGVEVEDGNDKSNCGCPYAYHPALSTVLTSPEQEVHACLQELYSNQPDSLRLLASDICRYVAMLPGPPGRRGTMPGTAHFGRWGGMSGLFVAYIIKKK